MNLYNSYNFFPAILIKIGNPYVQSDFFLIIIIKALPRSTICNKNFNYNLILSILGSPLYRQQLDTSSSSWDFTLFDWLIGCCLTPKILLCIAKLLPCGWYIDRKILLLSYYITSLSSSVHRHIGFQAMADRFLWNFLCVQISFGLPYL
jgi:hypothetical protein